MSDPIKDGGPAFPTAGRSENEQSECGTIHNGMTLRDYFAAKALNGILSLTPGFFGENKALTDTLLAAETAYLYADAMLAAREKKS